MKTGTTGLKLVVFLSLMLFSSPNLQSFSLTSTLNKADYLNASSLFKKPVQVYFKRDPILIGCEIAILVTCIYIAIELYKNEKLLKQASKRLARSREELQDIENTQTNLQEQHTQITTRLETICEEQQKADQTLQQFQTTATPNSIRSRTSQKHS